MIITDIMDNRLEVAKSMGADYTYKVITNIINNFISIVVPILDKPCMGHLSLSGNQGDDCRGNGR